MFKKVCILLGVAAAVTALAVGTVQGARGRGAAGNDRGQAGHFRMDVKKLTRDKHMVVEGEFLWEGHDRHAGARIRVYMRRAHEFAKDGNVGKFAGRAVIEIRREAGVHRAEGVVRVMVRDNRNPEHPGNVPDLLAFHFIGPTASASYNFEGHVREGDIQVYMRPAD